MATASAFDLFLLWLCEYESITHIRPTKTLHEKLIFFSRPTMSLIRSLSLLRRHVPVLLSPFLFTEQKKQILLTHSMFRAKRTHRIKSRPEYWKTAIKWWINNTSHAKINFEHTTKIACIMPHCHYVRIHAILLILRFLIKFTVRDPCYCFFTQNLHDFFSLLFKMI